MGGVLQVLAPGAEDLAAGLAGVLRKLAAGSTVAEADPATRQRYWGELAADQWPALGVDDGDGDGLSTVDLCRVAEEWGRTVLPVPLLPTVLARRWSGLAETDMATPLTVALPGQRGTSWVPFADFPGVQVVGWGRAPEPVSEEVAGRADEFSPTYPVGIAQRESTLASHQVAEARLLGLAEAIGIADGALERSVQYAKERHQFGRPIGSFQAVQHLLADMHRDVEIGRSLVLSVAHGTEPALVAAALHEGFCRAQAVVERAIQTHGGMGFTWELGLHWSLRHVLALARICTPAAAR